MKFKTILSTTVGALLSLTIVAQTTTVGVGTGTGNPGSTVNVWTVKTPNSANYVNAYYADAFQGYATNNCGDWITPVVDQNDKPSATQAAGIYKYRMEFMYSVQNCQNTATLDYSFIAGDNRIKNIYLNNTSVPVPTNPYIDFYPGGTINQTVSNAVVPGTNTLEIWVENDSYNGGGTRTALAACGQLQISANCDCYGQVPTGLKCTLDGSDHVLSWTQPTGALAYEIEITYEDPDCCEGGAPYQNVIWVGNSNPTHTFQPNTCYSWRVRSMCNDDLTDPFRWGPWSEKICGCEDGETEPGFDWGLNKSDGSGNAEEAVALKNLTIIPNPSTGVFQITVPEVEHFTYSVTGVAGETILQHKTSISNNESVDLSHLSQGVYYINIKAAGSQKVIPVMLQQ